MNLGENIYRLRTEKNLSQGDLADALDVSRQSVSKWENNSAVPELEKLIKMAQIFGITIDELVTGETKESVPVTTHTPPPESAPARQGLSPQQLLGIVLLIFGGLCLIVFTVVGIFTGLLLLGFFIALPFLLCGAICLTHKKNIGILCGCACYLPGWFIGNYVIARSHGLTQYFVGAGLLIAGIMLTAATMRRMQNGQITLSCWKRMHLTVAMILSIVITCLLCLLG